jgi:hypothetical protein
MTRKIRKFTNDERPSLWQSFDEQQQEVQASGLSSPADTSVLSTILGFTSGTYAGGTIVAISLHTAQLGTAKVTASEWTTTNSGYARIYAGTSGTGGGTNNWTLAAFVAGTGVVASNKTQVSFPAATGSAYPITLFSVGFWDNLTVGSGNLDWFADLASSQSIALNIIVAFFVGDITFTLQ